ncbi:MAG: nitroreductase family protein [Oscillospiraceae bacterium]|nr:nitroreductase family protein [Oscillospiraceae bacterium]
METLRAIETRRSIRKYKPDPIEPEKLEAILRAMRLSPSACNRQDWKFFIITDREALSLIAEHTRFTPDLVRNAPALLLAAGWRDKIMPSGHSWSTVDLTIAMTVGVLAATDLGLGTCIIGSHQEEDVRKALSLPDDWQIPLIATLGYGDTVPGPRPLKDFGEVAEIR